jgi:hypothetical protein
LLSANDATVTALTTHGQAEQANFSIEFARFSIVVSQLAMPWGVAIPD